ncbi:MAG: preprotein translocase subunit SecE [Oscillospiraceae bacterium]
MSKEVAAVTKAKSAKPKNGFFKKVSRFFKDLRSEFKKIVWPTKKQTMQHTGVVILFMGIAAIAIWSLDWVFINIFNLMLG